MKNILMNESFWMDVFLKQVTCKQSSSKNLNSYMLLCILRIVCTFNFLKVSMRICIYIFQMIFRHIFYIFRTKRIFIFIGYKSDAKKNSNITLQLDPNWGSNQFLTQMDSRIWMFPQFRYYQLMLRPWEEMKKKF